MTRSHALAQKLSDYTLILGSGSPRRKKFLEEMGLEFEVRKKSVDEVYPAGFKSEEISRYLAELKAVPFQSELEENEILLTSDTVVWHKNKSLAKANNKEEAIEMLKVLSGDWHEVITSVCFTTRNGQKTVSETTRVKFKEFTNEELAYYVEKCKPFDKAGAYGIQEWLGMIGISKIEGSYTNVVGLPTHLVYKTLMDMVS
ncbi:Maf family nucleotide pyrophosphatase [Flagellimonas allohymeniacidonis]|uniref:dTTP/UTP pyrophosphatase n=1 Tax=Flagellimonas allohymeniacidonis TaxID=2517819 RepID=A0A4Q8QJG9_9FLAO|nr:Maf family nucleotide pyrophosphatase [Allomuricauda hymeniacidonis]TAI48629.1 septum formation protein Maf [Allomuricauda hymeniacidonis]